MLKQIAKDFQIAALQADAWLNFQLGIISYQTFIELFIHYNRNCTHYDEFQDTAIREWLGSEPNELGNTSSGSTFTAIIDIDNLLSTWEDQITEDNYPAIRELYKTIIYPIRKQGWGI